MTSHHNQCDINMAPASGIHSLTIVPGGVGGVFFGGTLLQVTRWDVANATGDGITNGDIVVRDDVANGTGFQIDTPGMWLVEFSWSVASAAVGSLAIATADSPGLPVPTISESDVTGLCSTAPIDPGGAAARIYTLDCIVPVAPGGAQTVRFLGDAIGDPDGPGGCRVRFRRIGPCA